MTSIEKYQNGCPIVQFEIGSQQNFIYLILDEMTKFAAIIDPQKDLSRPLAVIKEQGFELKTILLTHTHFDHTAGVGPLLKIFPELEVRAGELDLHRLPLSISEAKNFRLVHDHETMKVGEIEIQALHTPGHSAGAFCYYVKKQAGVDRPYLFTGDTIFIRDCGRTDFESGSNAEMFASIQKIKKFPDNSVLLVGHHYAKEFLTTLGEEKKASPPFLAKSVEELANLP